MKALKSGNAQTTLSRRQQEQQAKIKKIAVAILIAILIFLALLMLESNLIQDEVYTYVLTAQTDIQAGTVVTEQNVDQLFQATAISSRSSDEYNKITLDPQIPNFNSADEAIEKRELIKVRVLQNCPEDIEVAITTLAERTNCDLVQIIGRNGLLWRRNFKKPKIELPK